MGPFYGWGSTASRLVPLWGGRLLFTTKLPDISGTHWPWKDGRLSQRWSHPAVLNTTLDWKSSALTTKVAFLVNAKIDLEIIKATVCCNCHFNCIFLPIWNFLRESFWVNIISKCSIDVDWRPATFLKRDSTRDVFLWIFWNL